MTREEIKAKLEDGFNKVRSKKIEVDINENSSLSSDVNLDSLERVEMLFELEQTFSIKISDEEAREFKTIKNIIDIIQEKIEHAN